MRWQGRCGVLAHGMAVVGGSMEKPVLFPVDGTEKSRCLFTLLGGTMVRLQERHRE